MLSIQKLVTYINIWKTLQVDHPHWVRSFLGVCIWLIDESKFSVLVAEVCRNRNFRTSQLLVDGEKSEKAMGARQRLRLRMRAKSPSFVYSNGGYLVLLLDKSGMPEWWRALFVDLVIGRVCVYRHFFLGRHSMLRLISMSIDSRSTDRLGVRFRADANVHLSRPLVRHMPPSQVPVDDRSCQNCHRSHLDHLTAHR